MSDQCFAGPGCYTESSGRLREQFDGPDPEQQASIVSFLLLDRPLGPNVENEMDDPNMHAYGEDGPDDAEIGRQWRENSSLEKWFPFTAEQLEAKERENLHLAREAHAWSKACEDATTKLYKLSTHHPRLEVRYWTGKYWEPLYGARFHEVLNALDLTPNAAISRPVQEKP